MSETIGFAFLSGLSTGIILSVLLVAGALSRVDKRRIKHGHMEHEGVIYKISAVKP